MSLFGKDNGLSQDLIDSVRKIMTGEDLEEAKMDPVDKKELKKNFKSRDDKDIDNDGDVDDSDEYLHTRRKAVKKSMKKDNGDDDSVKVNESDGRDPRYAAMRNFNMRAKELAKQAVAREKEAAKAKKTRKEEVEESADLNAQNVDKALKHDCATHVEHIEYGAGECIPGMHTIEETASGYGVVTHYDVMFRDDEGNPFIVEDVSINEMKVTKSESHMHTRKKEKK